MMNSNAAEPSGGRTQQPRRSFLRRALFALFALVAPRAAFALSTTPGGRKTADASLSRVLLSRHPADLPRIGYLPPNYRITSTWLRPLTGFRASDEVGVICGCSTPVATHNRPSCLEVFLTREDRTLLANTRGAGTPVRVNVRGEAIVGRYFAAVRRSGRQLKGSRPAAQWDLNTDNAHVLVLRSRDITVGIRGLRKAGITVEELKRVAEGLR